MAGPADERWPVITAYLLGSGPQEARVELEPFAGATMVELPVPRNAGLLWGMWNTLIRASNSWDETFINAAIVGIAKRGQLAVQLDPLVGENLVSLRLPADHNAFGRVEVAVLTAMRIATGQDEVKAAANILRERAATAAEKRNQSQRASGAAIAGRTRPLSLRARYEEAKELARNREQELKQAKSEGTGARVDACRKELAEAYARRATFKAALKEIESAGRKTIKTPKSKKTAQQKHNTGKKSGNAREPRRDYIPEVDSGLYPVADPDATSKMVWAFKSGRSYHERGCQLVENRDGANRISIATAHKRNLQRCRHCVPSLW